MYLSFSIGEEEYFLTEIGADTKIGEFRFYKMFDVRPMQPKERVLAAATAWHLFVWYRDNQFCGRCGKKLVHSEMQRMLQCPCCANMVFPKIAPAVIVGVTHGDKILMTNTRDESTKGMRLSPDLPRSVRRQRRRSKEKSWRKSDLP